MRHQTKWQTNSLTVLNIIALSTKALLSRRTKNSYIEEIGRTLILVGHFSYSDICWEGNRAGSKQFRRLLESFKGNVPVQVLDRATRHEVLLDLVLTNAEEIINKFNTGGSLGCRNYALVEFLILKNMSLPKGGVRTLNFRRVNFHLAKKLLDEIA